MRLNPANDLLYLLPILESVAKIKLFAGGYNDAAIFFEANDGKQMPV
jgi:hypothetical protein